MDELKPSEFDVLRGIAKFLQTYDRPPTISELVDCTNQHSPSTVTSILQRLEKKGWIKRSRGARGLMLVRPLPDDLVAPQAASPNAAIELFAIPLVGSIVAGQPAPVEDSLAAVANATEEVAVGMDLIPAADRSRLLFALRVHGDSMIDAFVEEGDVVIFKQPSEVRQGDMVAAWLGDRNEATLKHYFVEDGRVSLRPANPAMKDIVVSSPEDLVIQGVVVAIVKDYGLRS
jgi:repressor LexA